MNSICSSCRIDNEMRINKILQVVAAMFLFAGSSLGSALFEIFAYGDAGAVNSGDASTSNPFSVNLPNQTSYSSGVYSESGTYIWAPSGLTASGSSDVDVTAIDGVLGGIADAQGSFSETGTPVTFGTGSDSSGYIGWFDTFTVVSSILAAGTPVTAQVTNLLHSIVSETGGNSPGGADSTAAASYLQITGPDLSYNTDIINSYQDPQSLITDISQVTLIVGGTYQLEHQLVVVADAEVSTENLSGTNLVAVADAGTTSNSFIDILTPGATYTSASGANYQTPAVPEPSTFFIAAGGFAALWLSVSRRGPRGL